MDLKSCRTPFLFSVFSIFINGPRCVWAPGGKVSMGKAQMGAAILLVSLVIRR